MKKGTLYGTFAFVIFAAILVWTIVSVNEFPLQQNALVDDIATKIADEQGAVASVDILDADYTNHHAVVVFRVQFADGAEEYGAFAYEKHLLLSRYKYFHGSTSAGSGITGLTVVAAGFPYNVVYDYSDLSLAEVSRSINSSAKNSFVFAGVLLVIAIVCVIMKIAASNDKKNRN